MATITLLAEAIRGDVGPVEADIVQQAPTNCLIKMISGVFGADPTLETEWYVDESFDGGGSWTPASGFPFRGKGGSAGGPRNSDGLAAVQYAFDGRARRLKVSVLTKKSGAPASYSWGVAVTL